jgi:hypothetical protein
MYIGKIVLSLYAIGCSQKHKKLDSRRTVEKGERKA